MAELDRIRWHCRRGMLELDLVLTRFLERDFASLPPEQREAFAVLLEHPDDVLWDLVCGRIRPEAGAAAAVVRRLRES